MKQDNTQQPLWKVLNEQRTPGNWEGRQARGNNAYEFKVVVPNIKTICEMEANDLEDIKTVKANAKYTALAVNNLHILAEALEGMIEAHEDGGNIHYNDEYKAAKEALNRIS